MASDLLLFRSHMAFSGYRHSDTRDRGGYGSGTSNLGSVRFPGTSSEVHGRGGFAPRVGVPIVFAENRAESSETSSDVHRCRGLEVDGLPTENHELDFSSNCDDNDNVSLILEDRNPFIVSKLYLAMHSPVFRSMFFNEGFIESKSSTITLKDVKYDEFVSALKLIFPCESIFDISAKNVKSLLIIGDRFQMKVVMQQCEKFLISTNTIRPGSKIIYAVMFGLENLHAACRVGLNWYILKELMDENQYGELTAEKKVAVAEFVMKNTGNRHSSWDNDDW